MCDDVLEFLVTIGVSLSSTAGKLLSAISAVFPLRPQRFEILRTRKGAEPLRSLRERAEIAENCASQFPIVGSGNWQSGLQLFTMARDGSRDSG